jgi:hypothetical protein
MGYRSAMFGMGFPEIILTLGFVVIAVAFVKYFFIGR